MANENILNSYLMSIGFKIDEEGYKKFKDKQEESSKRIKELGENLEKFATIAASSATVLTASVIKISDRLTQLYYSSQIANSSARNLQAFKSAAEQVGISAEGAQQAVESMGMALRLNPQLQGLLKAFNINPDQDKVQVLLDLVDQLRKLPFYQAAQYANMFGMDSQTLLLLEQHRDELHKYFDQYQKLNAATDQQSAASRKFTQDLHDLENRFNKLWEIISTRLLPVGEELIKWLDEAIDLLIKADKVTDGWSSRIVGIGSAVVGVIGSLRLLKSVLGILGIGGGTAAVGETAASSVGTAAVAAGAGGGALSAGISVGLPLATLASTVGGYFAIRNYLLEHGATPERERKMQLLEQIRGSNTQDLVSKYAAKYGVDEGLLRALIHEEHGTDKFGRALVSPKGAIGMMQLMPATAKLLGVDPNDPEQNLAGGTHLLSDLLRKYGGNESLALSAYNAGEGAVDKYHGIPPFAETQQYVKDILAYRLAHPGNVGGGARVAVQQNVKIEVNGVGEPAVVSKDVVAAQARAATDLQRAMTGVVDR